MSFRRRRACAARVRRATSSPKRFVAVAGGIQHVLGEPGPRDPLHRGRVPTRDENRTRHASIRRLRHRRHPARVEVRSARGPGVAALASSTGPASASCAHAGDSSSGPERLGEIVVRAEFQRATLSRCPCRALRDEHRYLVGARHAAPSARRSRGAPGSIRSRTQRKTTRSRPPGLNPLAWPIRRRSRGAQPVADLPAELVRRLRPAARAS